MKLTTILFLVSLAIILIAQPVSSADKTVYSGWIYAGQEFKEGNITFTVMGTKTIKGDFPNNYTQVAIYKTLNGSRISTPVVLNIAECKDIDYYSYCFNRIEYFFNNPNTTDSQGYLRPMIDVKVIHRDAALKVDRPTSIKLPYNQSTEIPIVFRNNGIQPIEVIYSEAIPREYIVVDSKNMTITNNKIDLKFIVNNNSTKSFSYTIKNPNYDSYNWTAKYSYTYEGKAYDVNLSKLTITTPLPYTVKDIISKSSSTDIGVNFEYTIQVTNNDPVSALKTKVILDPGIIEVTNTKNMDEKSGYYSKEESIAVNKTIEYGILAKSKVIGDNLIRATVYLSINNKNYAIDLNKTFKLDLKGLAGSFETSKETISPGDELTIRLIINNQNPTENFYDVDGVFKYHGSKPISTSMIYHDDKLMIEEVFLVPEELFNVPGQAKFELLFDGSYSAVNGQTFGLRFWKNLTLNQSFLQWKNSTSTVKTTKPTTTSAANASNATTAAKPNETKVNTTTKKIVETDATAKVQKKDWLTGFFESLNSLIGRIFGKK
jgi:hypothetical protein